MKRLQVSRVSTQCLPSKCPTLDRLKPRILRLCGLLSGVSRVYPPRARVRMK